MKVLNKHRDDIPSDAVYIGRGSMWGNPFSHLKGKGSYHVNTRDEAVERYRAYLWESVRSNKITLEQLLSLDGKSLVCFCAPLACHGDVLIKAVQWAKSQTSRGL